MKVDEKVTKVIGDGVIEVVIEKRLEHKKFVNHAKNVNWYKN